MGLLDLLIPGPGSQRTASALATDDWMMSRIAKHALGELPPALEAGGQS
jgi:hypothetical protein